LQWSLAAVLAPLQRNETQCPLEGYLDVRQYFFANEIKVIEVVKIKNLHVDGLGSRDFPLANFGYELGGCSA
jgi:hypothetical protein